MKSFSLIVYEDFEKHAQIALVDNGKIDGIENLRKDLETVNENYVNDVDSDPKASDIIAWRSWFDDIHDDYLDSYKEQSEYRADQVGLFIEDVVTNTDTALSDGKLITAIYRFGFLP